MKYDFTHFTDELLKIKCTLNNLQLEQFELYYDLLIEKKQGYEPYCHHRFRRGNRETLP